MGRMTGCCKIFHRSIHLDAFTACKMFHIQKHVFLCSRQFCGLDDACYFTWFWLKHLRLEAFHGDKNDSLPSTGPRLLTCFIKGINPVPKATLNLSRRFVITHKFLPYKKIDNT